MLPAPVARLGHRSLWRLAVNAALVLRNGRRLCPGAARVGGLGDDGVRGPWSRNPAQPGPPGWSPPTAVSRRNQPELLEEPEVVAVLPALGDPSVGEAHEGREPALSADVIVGSSGQLRVLRAAASIADRHPVDPGDLAAGLDRRALTLVLAAIAHAGRQPRPPRPHLRPRRHCAPRRLAAPAPCVAAVRPTAQNWPIGSPAQVRATWQSVCTPAVDRLILIGCRGRPPRDHRQVCGHQTAPRWSRGPG